MIEFVPADEQAARCKPRSAGNTTTSHTSKVAETAESSTLRVQLSFASAREDSGSMDAVMYAGKPQEVPRCASVLPYDARHRQT